MELKTLSNKRGIYSIYTGSKYIIYSEVYGVVAESTNIIRNDDTDNVVIDFNICQWYGYWALKPIITKGINKLENRFIPRDVTINYNTIKGTENTLNRCLKIEILDR